MIGIHSVEQVRAVERAFAEANPDVELMQLAAERITEHALEMAPEGVITVAVGPGATTVVTGCTPRAARPAQAGPWSAGWSRAKAIQGIVAARGGHPIR